MTLALNNGLSLLRYSSIVDLNIDTSFVGIGALRADILILKAQICINLQTRASAFWP